MANKKNHNKEIKKGLYLIPTPIGNLGDITFRAVEILKNSDCILCEDTRISRNLLDKFDIKSKLISNHKFNEKKNLSYVVDLLKKKSFNLVKKYRNNLGMQNYNAVMFNTESFLRNKNFVIAKICIGAIMAFKKKKKISLNNILVSRE